MISTVLCDAWFRCMAGGVVDSFLAFSDIVMVCVGGWREGGCGGDGFGWQ